MQLRAYLLPAPSVLDLYALVMQMGALTTPDSPPRRTGHSSFWLMHSLMPCPGLESLPSALTIYSIFKVHAVPVANR